MHYAYGKRAVNRLCITHSVNGGREKIRLPRPALESMRTKQEQERVLSIARHLQRSVRDLERLLIVCDDCGRQRLWRREEIQTLVSHGVETMADAQERVVCSDCRQHGIGHGGNVLLFATWRISSRLRTRSYGRRSPRPEGMPILSEG